MKRKYTGYLLLAPAGIWLGAFFVIPFYSLLAASLYDPKGSVNTGYQMTWHVQNFPHVIEFEPLFEFHVHAYGMTIRDWHTHRGTGYRQVRRT